MGSAIIEKHSSHPTMPRSSERAEIIKQLEAFIVWKAILDTSDEEEEEKEQDFMIISEETPEELLEYALHYRYLEPRLPIPKSREWAIDVLPRYDEKRFRQVLRMSREAFSFVLSSIKSHSVFKENSAQFPVELQLQISLYRFGRFGNGASVCDNARIFGVSEGTVINSTRRILKAILSLEEIHLSWFTPPEAKAMKKRIFRKSGFRSCLGFLDGTTIVLAEKPIKDGEIYFNRKNEYGLNCQIVADLDRRIRYFFVGYPASVHDSRCIKESNFCTTPEDFFSPGEYVLADSAYTLSEHVITPFKKPTSLNHDNAEFNSILSSVRVEVEHCIGILKNRFGSLKGMRHRISGGKSAREVVDWVKACAILHNMALNDSSSIDFAIQIDPKKSDDILGDILEDDLEECVTATLRREMIMEEVLSLAE